jgi:TonB family protein
VQAARILNRVQPVYPPLARQTRISGTVRLHAIIGKDGTIQSLEVMSGHPLLQQAALDAVRQWRYQPTLLNGEPVDVDTTIDVIFSQPVVRVACRSWDRCVAPGSNIHRTPLLPAGLVGGSLET